MSVASAEWLYTFFLPNVVTLSNSLDEAARDAVVSLQGNIAHFQSTVRERLELLAGHGSSQGGPSGAQDDPVSGSVDPDSGYLAKMVFHTGYYSLKNFEN